MSSASIWTPGSNNIPVADPNAQIAVEEFTATAGQTDFTISNFVYTLDSNAIEVHVNGVTIPRSEVTELTTTSFQIPACEAGDIVEVVGNVEAVDAEGAAIAAAASAAAALASEIAAAASESAAATSASGASASASAAATSATAAATSATTATTQATNAATSATSAATSATAAAGSATSASTSATNAANSATTATTSATNASNSASAAATSATNASNSATAAAGSATSAATSATNASNSATAAAASAASVGFTLSSVSVFTNKTVNLTDNTLTGTKAQFDTACSDGNFLFSGADISVGTVTASGDIALTGSGKRITGDFSNATAANRVSFQSSTVNGSTIINAIPNGTSTASQWRAYDSSDTANSGVALFAMTGAALTITATQAGTGAYVPITFSTGGSERMRIDTSGQVGIGVTPAAWTNYKVVEIGAVGNHVAGTSSGALQVGSGYKFDSADKYAITGNFALYTSSVSSDGSFRWYSTATSGTAGNAATLVERMRIEATGKVGINNSSGTRQFNVKHTADSGDAVAIFEDVAATATNQYGVDIRLAGDPNNTSNYFMSCLGNATQRAAFRSNGGLANFSANDVNLSDESVKPVFELISATGVLPALWEAHKSIGWARYLYEDQTDTIWNWGYGARQVQEVFESVIPGITTEWDTPKTRQVTRQVQKHVQEVELQNGRYVLVDKVVDIAEPVFEEKPLFNPDGSPVMVVSVEERYEDTGLVDEDGKAIFRITPAEYAQATHSVPVMEALPVRDLKGVYSEDLKNITGMIVTELQKRVEALEQKLRDAGLA